MKIRWLVPTTLTVLLTSPIALPGNAQTLELTGNLQSDPLIVNGTSGGAKNSNCGFIGQAPNQTVKVNLEQIDYMRIRVEGEGDPTLMVKGPGGSFCVFADKTSGENPEISGVWLKGNYSIYVGDRSGGQHPYKLLITQKRD